MLKARWRELEEGVYRWALEERVARRGLSTVQLTLAVAKEMNMNKSAGELS